MIKWWDRMVDGLVTLWPKENDEKSFVDVSPYTAWWMEESPNPTLCYNGDKQQALEELVHDLENEIAYHEICIQQSIKWLEAVGNKELAFVNLNDDAN